GYGAHADPAAELGPAIERATAAAGAAGRSLRVVVSLCGTAGDPQGLAAQRARLVAAGAWVRARNLDAARPAAHLAGGAGAAGEVIPGMTRRTLLHAGPPLAWEAMCGPMRGAIVGALIYEGLADTPEAAERLAAAGEIDFTPCHEHQAVGPMAGITSWSMPVCVGVDTAGAGTAYVTFNEGLGRA